MLDSKPAKHLPYVNLFINPNSAFRELTETLPTVEVFVSFLLVSVLISFFVVADFITPPQRHLIAQGVRYLWHWSHVSFATARFYSLLTIPYFFVSASLSCLMVYACARILGATLRLKAFWTGYMFIEVPFMILMYWAEPVHSITWLLLAWKIVLWILMLRVMCGFSIGRAIGAYTLLVVLGAGLLTITLLTGVITTFGNSSFLKRFLKPPTLTPIHAPADYAWAAQELNGNPRKMDTLRGKVVVLNFWATWCTPCRAEMPSLQRLYDQVKDQDIMVIAISEEKAEKVQSFLKGKNYTFPILVRYERIPLFQSTSYPVTFIISPDGYLVNRHEGAAQWDSPDIVSYLQSLKNKSTPSGAGPGPGEINLGLDNHNMALVLNAQAVKLVYRHQYEAAEKDYHRALELIGKDPKPENAGVIATLTDGLGYIEYKRGHYPEADILYQKAIRIEKAQTHPDNAILSRFYANRSHLLFAMHRLAEVQKADSSSKQHQHK